jgi:hypothetical protein
MSHCMKAEPSSSAYSMSNAASNRSGRSARVAASTYVVCFSYLRALRAIQSGSVGSTGAQRTDEAKPTVTETDPRITV